jgi:FHS family glucose/mannose:H+ symporter-like MFS transporter
MYNRKKVFIAACLGLFLFGMTLITQGSIQPELKAKFADDPLDEGILGAILPAGILLGSIVFGPIVDRYGYKLLLIISTLISAVALAGLSYTQSSLFLYASIFIIGFGGGMLNGITSALVSDISSENKGANLSLLGVSYGVGALGIPLLLGLLSKSFSYDIILATVAIFMILPTIYFITLKFPAPRHSQGFPLKEGIKMLKEPILLITSFFLFFQSAVEYLVNVRTTSFLQETLQVSSEKSKYALSFMLLGLTVSRLVLGGLLKKMSSFTLMIISLVLVAIGAIVLLYGPSYELAFAALILIGIGLAGGFPVILGYIGQLYAHLSGTAFSIAIAIALIGNTLINYLFGQVVERYGVSYMPFAVLFCIGCMLILMIIIRRKVAVKGLKV